MTRRLRRAVCVLFLALWVVAGLLSVRSDTHADVAEWRRIGRVYGACSRSGRLSVYATTYPPGEVTSATGFRWYQAGITGLTEGVLAMELSTFSRLEGCNCLPSAPLTALT